LNATEKEVRRATVLDVDKRETSRLESTAVLTKRTHAELSAPALHGHICKLTVIGTNFAIN
jgi:hypothetical protein